MTRVTPSSNEASDERPRITVVAHWVDDSGGMERVHADLVLRLLDHYRFNTGRLERGQITNGFDQLYEKYRSR
ncbi:MAG: hypothetical protein ACLQRH_29065 [Acidimicrobiales bacterium]